MKERVKLSVFAKSQGITYQSAWKMWEQGMIEGIKLESGTILVSGWTKSVTDSPKVVIYARVSDPKKVDDLKTQISRAEEHCEERNYEIVEIIKEVTPGVVLNRPQLVEALQRDNWDILVIEDKRIIAPVGFELFAAALGAERKIETLDEVEVEEEMMLKLFQRIVMWTKQIYGQGAQKKNIIDLMQKINY